MEWISVKDKLPDETIKNFICLIGDKAFQGRTRFPEFGVTFMDIYDDEIIYDLSVSTYTDKPIVRGWVKPSHFGEVSHWIPIPTLPRLNV